MSHNSSARKAAPHAHGVLWRRARALHGPPERARAPPQARPRPPAGQLVRARGRPAPALRPAPGARGRGAPPPARVVECGCVWGTRRSQKVTLLVALNFYAPLCHAMADACTDLARVLYSAPILPPATRDRAHSTDHGARNTARTTSVSRYVAPPQAIAGVGVIAATRSRRRMSSPVAGLSPVPHVGCAFSPGNDRGVGGAALEAASALSTRCTSARSTLPQPEPQPGDRLRAGRACTSATRGNAV